MSAYEYPPEWDVRDRENERPDWNDPEFDLLASAYHDGVRAREAGFPLSANPYSR